MVESKSRYWSFGVPDIIGLIVFSEYFITLYKRRSWPDQTGKGFGAVWQRFDRSDHTRGFEVSLRLNMPSQPL